MTGSERSDSAVDRRDLLLEAALAAFVEQPFDAVSLAQIATRAGVAYGLIAHYFGGKRGIYLAAMQAMADRLRASRDQPAPPGVDRADTIRQGVRRHIAYLDSQATGFTALMRGGIGADPDVRHIVARLRWEGAERVLEVLQARRPFSPLLRTAMHGWVGFLDEAVLDWLEKKDVDRETLATLIVRVLGASLLTLPEEMTGIRREVLVELAERG